MPWLIQVKYSQQTPGQGVCWKPFRLSASPIFKLFYGHAGWQSERFLADFFVRSLLTIFHLDQPRMPQLIGGNFINSSKFSSWKIYEQSMTSFSQICLYFCLCFLISILWYKPYTMSILSNKPSNIYLVGFAISHLLKSFIRKIQANIVAQRVPASN